MTAALLILAAALLAAIALFTASGTTAIPEPLPPAPGPFTPRPKRSRHRVEYAHTASIDAGAILRTLNAGQPLTTLPTLGSTRTPSHQAREASR